MAGEGFVYVRSGFDNNRVALHEVDAEHPSGSVIVAANSGPVKVGNTALVRQRLRDGWLVEVTNKADKEEADRAAAERSKRLSATTDAGASVLTEQFTDTRTWPGSEPTDAEVAADRAPKVADKPPPSPPQVPVPPKSDKPEKDDKPS